jgi:hypothetical protein
MKRFGFSPWARSFLKIVLIMLPLLMATASGWAALGQHTAEAPEAKFTRDGDKITATLIPRAKSSSVRITFDARGARLDEVTGTPFAEAAHPEMDHKDFKSNLFTVKAGDISPGSEVTLAVSSDFFSKSTEYWVFNKNPQPTWQKADVDNIAHPGRVRDLIVTVKDGGPLDADGAADGRITLIGGAKDSFWGYALGTLFIRFFGIFLVLSVLMAGMYFSGCIFQMLEAREKASDAQSADTLGATTEPDTASAKGAEADSTDGPSLECVLAISAAIHMELSSSQASTPLNLTNPEVTSWTQQGRERIMSMRFLKH